MIQHLAKNCRCSRDYFERIGAALGSEGVLSPCTARCVTLGRAVGCSPGTAPHAAEGSAPVLSLPCCSPPSQTLTPAGLLPPLSPQGAGSSSSPSNQTQLFPFSVSQAHCWGCAQARCLQGEVSCWEQSLPLGWGDYSDL